MRTLTTLIISLLLFGGCSSSEKPVWTETTIATGNVSRPTIAIDSTTETIYAAWVETKESVSNVYLSYRKAGETEFSDPVRVNSIRANAAAGAQLPPQVTVSPTGLVYVTWIDRTAVKGRAWPASDIYVVRSSDGGQTFAPGVTVDNPPFPTGQGFHDIAVGPKGIVYISWLDTRAGDRPAETASKQSHRSPANTMHEHYKSSMGTQVRVARSMNHAKSFSPGKVIARNTCQCCRTAITVGDDGIVYVAWRNIFDTQIRDIAIARSTNRGKSFTSPVRVHHDDWKIRACLHAGPSVIVTNKGKVLVFWFTGAHGKAGAYMTKAAGKELNFGEAILLPSGRATSQVEADVNGIGDVWFVWENYSKSTISIGNYIDGNINKLFATINEGRLPSIAASNKYVAVTWLASDSIKVRVYKLGEA